MAHQPQSAVHSSQFGGPVTLGAALGQLSGTQEGQAGLSGLHKRERSEEGEDEAAASAKRARV